MQYPSLLSWSAPERAPHMRSKWWYLIMGSVAVSLIAYAIATKAWSFVAVLGLLVVVYGIVHRKPHPTHTIDFSEAGLTLDKTFIPWSQCTGYWMLQGPNFIELHIETVKSGTRHVRILTDNKTPHEINDVLSQFVSPIHDRGENLLDYIIRICKL